MKLSDVFTTEYLSMMERHRDRIKKAINTYDVVIFMARKAICLYKAFLSNGEITANKDCVILSSRVITFDCIELLKGKTIAVIDDVVVRGKSIKYVMEILEKYSLSADVYIMAEEIGNNDSVEYDKYICNASQHLSAEHIDQFSNQITQYIHLSGISYNIDHPIFKVGFDSEEECKDFLAVNRCVNLTDGKMRKHGVERYTLHFSNKDNLIHGINADLIKIRFIHRVGTSYLTAIPMFFFPSIGMERISHLFDQVADDDYKRLVKHNNILFEQENKYKVLQYLFSEYVIRDFFKSQNIRSIRQDMCNEKIVFSITHEKKADYEFGQLNESKTVLAYKEDTELQSAISHFYSLLFDKVHHDFFDGFGRKITEKIITREDVKNDGDILLASCVLDIMIDKGILIPSLVHTENDEIIRAYKLGEIFKLHKKGIELFHYMMYQYFLLINERPIYRTEFEKWKINENEQREGLYDCRCQAGIGNTETV